MRILFAEGNVAGGDLANGRRGAAWFGFFIFGCNSVARFFGGAVVFSKCRNREGGNRRQDKGNRQHHCHRLCLRGGVGLFLIAILPLCRKYRGGCEVGIFVL